MNRAEDKPVIVMDGRDGPYAQFVTAGRHVMAADEPERLGGHATGPSPYEYLLVGLAPVPQRRCACMPIGMVGSYVGSQFTSATKRSRVPKTPAWLINSCEGLK